MREAAEQEYLCAHQLRRATGITHRDSLLKIRPMVASVGNGLRGYDHAKMYLFEQRPAVIVAHKELFSQTEHTDPWLLQNRDWAVSNDCELVVNGWPSWQSLGRTSLVELWTKPVWEQARSLRAAATAQVVAESRAEIEEFIHRSEKLNDDHGL